ncbi:MAG: DUF4349 domain-containing protein [Oscillospiraceae bacterium]|nr:DUF4349 domain-containing protein [Oscillospiraceae bacterium]
MKKKSLALLTALLLLLLTACGSGGSDGAFTSAASSQSMPNANMDMNMADMMPEAPALEESGWDNGTSYGGGTVPANTKMILTGELNLETKEFDSAVQAVDALVKELGGWYESRSIHQGGRYRSVNAVVRVPAQNFSALMDRAGEIAHKVYGNDQQQDVSEAYYDNEARLTTQRTKLERLQALLAQAESMEDIIVLESAISETELQIEYLTGSLRKYDNLVDYATVTLYLEEVYRLSTDQEVPLTFSQRLGDAFISGFQRGIEGLEDFAIGVARNWMTLLLLAVVVGAAVPLIRRQRRKRQERTAPPPPAQTERQEKDVDK